MLAPTVAPHRPAAVPGPPRRSPRRARALARTAFVAALAVNLLVLYAPRVPAPPTGDVGLDKLVHGAVFALLVLTGLRAGLRAGWFVPVVVAHALASELVQELLLAQRHGDAWDAVADLAGVTLGVLVWRRLGRTGA